MVQIKHGDLLLSKEDFIVHQCNTTSKGASGLAYTIFMECPESNTYDGEYAELRKVGTVSSTFSVINLYGQRHPGRANNTDDTATMRLKWFKQGLFAISKNRDIESLAFPYLIGSSLAGGKWDNYLNALLAFDEYLIEQGREIDIVIYKLEK